MPTSYWLIKSEPTTYSYAKLVAEKRAQWDGVRNYTARNHLREMALGDLALFYHSSEGKEIVGVARVSRTAFADPTAEEGDWSAVEVEPVTPLARPVTLDEIRKDPLLSQMQMIKLNRLSVTKVTKAEFDAILKAGKTKLPKK